LEEQIIAAVVTSIVAFFSVYFVTPFLIKALEKRNLTVKDYNRKGGAQVARLGGISIIIGVIASMLTLYAFIPISEILAILITSSLAFVVGIIDDRRVMGGWFKPIALALCTTPILLLGTFDTNLAFPLFGEVKIPILYFGLAVIMIPITGNTINSIDVLNGVASGFTAIASFALSAALIILQNYEIALASLALGFLATAFYKYHKYPSRIFPGDSGALVFGAMYGAIAIVGQVEVIAAIAILPAIINSFLFLDSVKRIVEHRKTKNPTYLRDDFKLESSDDITAPITLVRLLVARGPLSEKQIGFAIFKLAIFSGALAVFSAFLMGVTF